VVLGRLPKIGLRLTLGLLLAPSAAVFGMATKTLSPPFELQWGGAPEDVANLLSRIMRPIPAEGAAPVAAHGGATANAAMDPATGMPITPPSTNAATQKLSPAGISGLFVTEQHYEGEIFAAKADRITPVFFMSQLFGVAASFPPSSDTPASLIWERLVDQVTRQYGKPRFKSKPVPLLSWNAVLQVVPPEANKSALLSIYNEADRDPKNGRYVLQDLQVQSGLWVPEAFWNFADGGAIKVVMRASGRNEFGLIAIKPLILILRHDMVP
jgi:hypothetical protein